MEMRAHELREIHESLESVHPSSDATRLWNPPVRTSDSTFGVGVNGFGFTITGNSGLVVVVVVDANSDLLHPVWTGVGTNILTDGSSHFSDSEWTDYLTRLYRLSTP